MRIAHCTFLFAAAAYAQTFDVASIKASPPRSGEAAFMKLNESLARIGYENVTVRFLISMGFEVPDSRIEGGDKWLDSERFDITATHATESDKARVRAMLKNLLIDRFGVTSHVVSRQVPAYTLVIAKNGSKLKPSTDLEGKNYILPGHIICSDIQLGGLAEILTRQTGRPVVDATGLPGRFNIDVTFTPDSASADTGGPSLYTAVTEQLGLELKPTKAPVEYLVIDGAKHPAVE